MTRQKKCFSPMREMEGFMFLLMLLIISLILLLLVLLFFLATDLITFARTPELHLSPEQLAHLFQGSPQDTAARSNPDLVRMILAF